MLHTARLDELLPCHNAGAPCEFTGCLPFKCAKLSLGIGVCISDEWDYVIKEGYIMLPISNADIPAEGPQLDPR